MLGAAVNTMAQLGINLILPGAMARRGISIRRGNRIYQRTQVGTLAGILGLFWATALSVTEPQPPFEPTAASSDISAPDMPRQVDYCKMLQRPEAKCA